MITSKCACGKRKSKYSNQCRKCSNKRHDKAIKDAQEIVAKGKCPMCNSELRRNSAMSGWYQCEQYGAEGFRKDGNKPSCSFQTFTQ